MLTSAALGAPERAAPAEPSPARSREIDEGWLRGIAAAASSLEERIEGRFAPSPGTESERLAARRLERWCEIVAEGDIVMLERRLGADGLSIERVLPLLGDAEWPADCPLPDWTRALADLFAEIEPGDGDGDGATGLLDPRDPLPFEEGLAPFVRWASRRLASRAGELRARLSGDAASALERALLVELSKLMGPTLHLELTVLVHRSGSDLDRWLARSRGERPRSSHRRLVAALADPRGLFSEYPVLGRLVVGVISRWVESCALFLARLERDLPDLRRVFGGDRPLGAVTRLLPDLSDPHEGRKMVFGVGFESGVMLAYKPRSVDMEQGLDRLFAWMRREDAPVPLRAPRTLAREHHGWVEWVEESPCREERAVERYFERAGALLAVVHALFGTDCHAGNIVAAGEEPVLVDAETLFQPEHAKDLPSGAGLGARLSLERSVIRTALLPHRLDTGAGGAAVDPSGLGVQGEATSTYPLPRWQHIGTDDMTLSYEAMSIPPPRHRCTLHGRPVAPEDHVDRILNGFDATTRFLTERGEALFAPGGPLDELRGARVRCVFRDTAVYCALGCRLRAPHLLRSGVERSLELDALLRAAAPFTDRPRHFALFAAEKRAMEALDIPYFATTTDSDALPLDDGSVVTSIFDRPAFEHVRARMLGSTGREVHFQKTVIRTCLALRGVAAGHADGAPEPDQEEAPRAGRRFVEAALEIAGSIRDGALESHEGVSFIAPVFAFEHDRMQLRVADESLYAGTPGIAVFLAAASRVAGPAGAEIAAFARRVLAPVRALLRDREGGEALARRLGLGGATGMGSILYALSLIARLLDDPALAAEALDAARFIEEDAVGADRDLDVVGGSAGAILGLLAVHDLSKEPELLQRATGCAEHLLRSRVSTPSGHRAWPYKGGRPPLAGFSHGAAGVACALIRLFARTGDERLRDAAREAVAYERTLFDAAAGDFRDLRPEAGKDFPAMCGWCHGAAGVGLARIRAAEVEDGEEIRDEIAAAAETTLRAGLGAVDHLCCGNAGRAELLLSAGRHLRRPELVTAASALLSRVDARAVRRGGYAIIRGLEGHVAPPSLFRGIAGVGYQLLRVEAPALFPSVLGWET